MCRSAVSFPRPETALSHWISAAVEPASGGGGTEISSPDRSTQVFHAPALASIWAEAAAVMAAMQMIHFVISSLHFAVQELT
jgi:hypothetical protein